MKHRVLLPILLPLLLSGSFARAGSDEEKVLRDLGPDKKICLCAFRLQGADAEKNNRVGWFGLVGMAINARREDSPYSQELAKEFQGIFEQALRGTGAFQLSAPQGLVGERDGKPLTTSEVAQENGLFACLTAESALGVGIGFKKKVKVATTWQLTGPSGWQLEIETEATPEQAQSTFPNPGDPKFKPVLLQLARDSARQFLEQFSEMATNAGASAKITIVDLDEVPVGSLLDPGTLPQPEPDCALNSEGKWEKRIALGDGVDLALVYIPSGDFLMGSAATLDDEGSQPQHQVTIDRAFWMGKVEVTQAQWKAVMATNPSKFRGDELPVDSVSWNESTAYLSALNQRLGRDRETALRLPTEAEWEYACRAGTTTKYSFSDADWNLASHAWFESDSASTTHPVGRLRPNPWGLFDMYGNVAEWCEDTWHWNYEGAPAGATPWLGDDEDRVRRGGHWDTSSSEVRSHSRDHYEAKKGDKAGGVRLVMPALHPQTVVAPSADPDATVATPAVAGSTASAPAAPAPAAPAPPVVAAPAVTASAVPAQAVATPAVATPEATSGPADAEGPRVSGILYRVVDGQKTAPPSPRPGRVDIGYWSQKDFRAVSELGTASVNPDGSFSVVVNAKALPEGRTVIGFEYVGPDGRQEILSKGGRWPFKIDISDGRPAIDLGRIGLRQ